MFTAKNKDEKVQKKCTRTSDFPIMPTDDKRSGADEYFTASSRSFLSIAFFGSSLLAMFFFSRTYHFRILAEIDRFQDAMPNNSIPLPSFHSENKSHSDGLLGLKHTEKCLMEWQEAFYTYRFEMTVRLYSKLYDVLCYIMN